MIRRRLGGIELGGTKTFVLLAEGSRIVERVRLETRSPRETLAAANSHLRRWADAEPLAALGIASFGPLQLGRGSMDFGHMLSTPKRGWAGADVAGVLSRGIGCPVAIDTDVNGAAMAEHRWGAGQGINCLWYVTIGTGLGGGLLVGGRPHHGAMHPEIGHVRIRRRPDDGFAGTCPFHGDCIEGLISGPALAQRFGMPAESVGSEDPRWRGVAEDLAELIATLLLTTAAQRILLGGSVAMRRAFLLPMVRQAVAARLADYLPFATPSFAAENLILAALGDEAGPMGAIALALSALEQG